MRLPIPFPYELEVRYQETDQMGFVHHSVYLVYFEAARVALLRAMGKPYRELEREGVLLPLVESHVRYRRPAFFEDRLTVWTWVAELRPSSFRMGYRITRETEEIATGWTRHAALSPEGRVLRLRGALRELLERGVWHENLDNG